MKNRAKVSAAGLRVSLCVIALLGLSAGMSAQTTKTITIDFKEKTIEGVESVKEGEQVQFKITNINPNNWQVSINAKDSLLYQSLKTPGFTSLNIADLSSLLEIASGGGNKAVTNPPSFPGDPAGPKDFYTEQKKELLKSRFAVNHLQQEILQEQVKAFTIDERLNGSLTMKLDVANYLSQFATERKKVEDVQTKTLDEMQAYATTVAGMKIDAIKDADAKKAKQAEVAAQQGKYKELMALSDTLLKVLDPNTLFGELSDFTYYHTETTVKTFPMYLGKDLKTVTLNFQPRAHAKFVDPQTIELELPRYPRFYYSVGMSFYGAGLKQERYAGEYLSDSTITVKKEPGIGSEIGMASLLRAGVHLGKGNSGAHFSFGPGVSIADKPQLRVLIGGGLFLGSKHQGIGIDGGLILGNVDVKSNTITEGDVLPNDFGSLTVSKLDWAFFLSVGYMYKF